MLATVCFAESSDHPFSRAAAPNPSVTILMYNYSNASPVTITAAEREAGQLLGQAGVEVVWLDCRFAVVSDAATCESLAEANCLRVRILAPPRRDFRGTVFGFAIHPLLASVYYEYAVRLAKKDNAEHEIPLILGGIMAHEIGHLMLGPSSHSSAGIMQAKWTRKQMNEIATGHLVFTPDESRIMREHAASYLTPAIETETVAAKRDPTERP